MITVLNAKAVSSSEIDSLDLVLYCGRESSFARAKNIIGDKLINCSFFGNTVGERTAESYEKYLEAGQLDERVYRGIDRLRKLHNQGCEIGLVCWCQPNPCHCDSIVEYALEPFV